MYSNDWSKHVKGALVLAIACLAARFIMPLKVFVPELLVLVPILLAYTGVRSGPVWAAAAGVCAAVCAWLGGGWLASVGVLVGMVLPAAVQYWTYVRRMPFERAVRMNICAYFLLGMATLLLVRVVAGDIAALEVAYVRSMWDRNISYDLFSTDIVSNLMSREMLLSLLAAKGYVTNELAAALAEGPTAELYQRCIDYAMYMHRYVVSYSQTGLLVVHALLAGIIMTAWPRSVASRSMNMRSVSYIPLRDWFMSGHTALGACAIYAVASLLLSVMPEWWYGVDYALKQCVIVLMSIQGVAAMERYMRKGGAPRGMRGAALLVITLMFRDMVTWIGVASALLGSHGAISTWIQKMRNEHGNDDE